jgi:hypothetical protein
LDNDALIQDVIQRFNKAKSLKTQWEPLYRDAMDYLAPHRQTFNTQQPGVDKTNPDKVFDSTATSALMDFVSNLISAVTPHRKNWMKLKPGSLIDNKQREAATAQLEDITKTLFQYLHMSNFHTEFATSLSDLGIGTGAMLVNKGRKGRPFVFQAVPISEVYLEQGPYGRVDTAFRHLEEYGRNVLQMWDDADINETLTALFDAKKDEKQCFIEASLAGEYDFTELDENGKPIRVKRYGYRYVVVHEQTKSILVNRLQRSTPWIVFRWSTLTGEIYGRGPALMALPDTKSINVTKELLLKGASRAIMGIWLSQDDGVTNFDNIKTLQPGMVIPVDFTSGERAGLVELPFNANVNLVQFVFNDMQIAIKRMMYSEPLGRVDQPVKSVYELQSRQSEWARRIGSPFGRLEYECLIPLINRCLFILDELDIIDMSGFLVDGEILGIDFVSPLAQSQDLEDLQGIQGYVSFLLQTFGPQIGLGLCKPEIVAKHMVRLLAVPSDIKPTDAEIEQMKQAVQQQAAMQSAQQTQQLMADGQAMEGQTNGVA